MSEQPKNLRFETLQPASLRISAGIEHIADIKSDLQQAFEKVFSAEPVG